jgi:hypothetical protein
MRNHLVSAKSQACPDLILLYSHHPGLGSGPFATDYLIHGNTDRLHLRSIDIAQREVAIVVAMFHSRRAQNPLVAG